MSRKWWARLCPHTEHDLRGRDAIALSHDNLSRDSERARRALVVANELRRSRETNNYARHIRDIYHGGK